MTLWVPLFAPLKTYSLYRIFYSREAIARETKIQLDTDNTGNELDY